MRNHYGWRAVLVMLLFALGCRLGIAQIGPRYVVDLPAAGSAAKGGGKGQVEMLGRGMMLLRFQDLSLLMLNADVQDDDSGKRWPAADLVVATSSHGWQEGCRALIQLADHHQLPMIVPEAEGSPPAAVPCYPMQAWDALHLRKGKVRLRATAMAGPAGVPGVGGFMLDLGDGHMGYRIFLSAEQSLADTELAALLERMPGADMVAWQNGTTQRTSERSAHAGAVEPPSGSGTFTFAARRR